MKTAAFIAFLLCAAPALAQVPGVAAERARIAAERTQAQARYAEEEKACWAKFAVVDCQNEAKARRREVLADLRRQEVGLNDAERKRKAAERLADIESRNSPQRQQEAAAQRAKALAEQKERDDRAAEKAADRAAADAKRASRTFEPRQPSGPKNQPSAAQSRDNQREHQERLQQAQERREKAARREAERTKPPAASLPVPQ